MHSQSTASFSHIRVVSPEHLGRPEPRASEPSPPFFSKPSFQSEADAVLRSQGNPNRLTLQPTTESLASHASGATFASKARAAELKAARARQELRTDPVLVSVAVNISKPGNMPKRPRSKLTWKKVNLSDLPDAEQGEYEGTDSFSQTKDPFYVDEYEVSASVLNMPTEETMRGSESSFDVPNSLWNQHEFRNVNYTSKHEPLLTAPDYPMPELMGSNNGNVEMSLTSVRPTLKMAMDSLPPLLAFPKRKENSSTEQFDSGGYDQHSQMYLRPQYPPRNFNNRPGSADPRGVSAVEAWNNNTFQTYPMSSSTVEVNPRATIPQLKAKPPHLYPAVRGTKSAAIQRAFTSTLPSGVAMRASSQPINLESNSRPKYPSSEEPHHMSTQPFVSAQVNDTSPWREPYVSSGQQSTVVGEDETIAWGKHGVPVFSPSDEYDEYPVLFGMRTTPYGVFPVSSEQTGPKNIGKTKAQGFLYPGTAPLDAEICNAKMIALTELENSRMRETTEQEALRAANFSDDPPSLAAHRLKSDANNIIIEILLPALIQLSSYRSGSRYFNPDYFHRMNEAPGWCVDHGPDGDRSFFGGDWGTPPARLGRDPRYRLQYDGSGRNSSFVGWKGNTQREGKRIR